MNVCRMAVIVTSVKFLAGVSQGSAGEGCLLTQEYGYFHMLYRRVNKAVHNHAS